MNQEFYDAVEANPVIAAVKNDAGLQAAVEDGRNSDDLCALWRCLYDPGNSRKDQS